MIASFLCFNRPDLAQSMIEQLQGLSVAVLDNGSEPPLAEQLHKGFEDEAFRIWRCSPNRQFSGGWNYFMFVMRNVDYVLMANDDITGISPAIVRNLVDALEADETLAAVSPVVPESPWRGTHSLRRGMRDLPFIDWLAPMMRVSAWNDVGGFDEQFAGYGADLDLCARLVQKGWKLAVNGDVVVHHPTPGATRISTGTSEAFTGHGWHDRLVAKWGKPSHVLAEQGP